MKRIISLVLLLAATMVGYANVDKLPAPLFTGIGKTHFRVDTHKPLAQRYFNQGLSFFYGFDYAESIRSFAAATKIDPKCARCYWGYALALGSLANAVPQGDEIARAHRALDQAAQNIKRKDHLLGQLIKALRLRYKAMKDKKNKDDIIVPYANALAFSNAMWQIALKQPQDDNIQALFGFSTIDVVQWDWWDNLGHPRAYTLMALKTLNKAIRLNPHNLGAIHYLIHVMEWSPNPKAVLSYARELPKVAPLLEHLVHMPTHIYLRLGDYSTAVFTNLKATEAFHIYQKTCQEQGFKAEDTFLNQHNYDFLFSSAIMQGNQKVAVETAEAVRKEIKPQWLTDFPFQQKFYAERYWAKLHFGLWHEIFKEPKPDLKFKYLTMMWWYAQGIAMAHKDQVNKALSAQKEMVKLADKMLDNKNANRLFKLHARLAKLVLQANISSKLKKMPDAILNWQRAAKLQSEKVVGDPPQWYFPCVEGLGFAMLKANHPRQAIYAFDADLKLFPNNAWALYGKLNAYRKLHDLNHTKQTEKALKAALKHSPLKLPLANGNEIMI